MYPTRFMLCTSIAISCISFWTIAIAKEEEANKTLPALQLRGMGVVSGAFTASTPSNSLLTIDASNAENAKLVHAKFLSDLKLLPGVTTQTVSIGQVKFDVHVVEGQGIVAAFQDANKVNIFTAVDNAQLLNRLKTSNLTKNAVSMPMVKVPMWLDRWDKFGFRFYYRPWEVPPGKTISNYNFINEFEYAQKQSRSGLVFWNDLLQNDTADGLTNYGWWGWAEREANNRDLPVGINTSDNSPTWFLNRYRDQTQLKMPGFSGNYHRLMSPQLGGQGVVSWNAAVVQDALLGVMQSSIRRFAKRENVVSFLEPHGELYHGNQDIFLEYGPVADANYRSFLLEKYGSVSKVSARWEMELASWDDVRIPEVASFAGMTSEAIEIGGDWRVGYEELIGREYKGDEYPEREIQASKPAPVEWFEPDFDDSTWPIINTVANDQQFYTPKRPAVFRRTFDVPATWMAKSERVWLYVWDLNLATRDTVRYVFNGKQVGTSAVQFVKPHWDAVEVTSAINPGKNTLALRLPQGYIAYKAYLSDVEPKQYPDLGQSLNARWVDFADFTQWSRLQAAQRGMEMIRQVDLNRQITLMHPDEFADGIKNLALEYGGNFHNTGWMGAFWGDYLNSVMRGAGLPFSLEPSTPAPNLAEFKKQLGLYQTEGIQGIDYFIHVGSILWKGDIARHFEANRRQLELIGKYHYPEAETAVLYSDRVAQLTRYPWGYDPNTDLGGGYWQWNAAAVLRGTYPYDGLTQGSFASGDASRYRVIIDSNTSIADDALISDIEKWVREGGTFVTLAQTGRHTPEKPNSWPIARLTGYEVSGIDAVNENGGVNQSGTLKAAPNQTIMSTEFNGITANGLHLKRVSSDTQDLLLWNDGSVAAGCRPLGKGFIVQLGAKFSATKISSSIEPEGNTQEVRQLRILLTSLLTWRGIQNETVRLDIPNDYVMLRPAVSNNGLYNVWTLWNQSLDKTQTVNVNVQSGTVPAYAIDARDGKRFELNVNARELKNIAIEPLETRVFLTPRQQLVQAPLIWFELQRKWWRGTKAPDAKPFPVLKSRFALDLSENWEATPPVAGAISKSQSSVAKPRPTVTRLGIWNTTESGKKVVLRKSFVVPEEWKDGRITLWLCSWHASSFVNSGRVLLDGREIKSYSENGLTGRQLEALTPGSSHVISIEVKSDGVLGGLRGQCWLAFEPKPVAKLNLKGGWEASDDGLRYDDSVALPGDYNSQLMRRSVLIEDKHRGKSVYVTVDGSGPLVGVIVNGTLVRRHHSLIGNRWSLNITPFVHFGQQNKLQLATWGGIAKGSVQEVSLGFFNNPHP